MVDAVRRVLMLQRIERLARRHGFGFERVRSGEEHEVWRFRELDVVIPRHRVVNQRTGSSIWGACWREARR